MKFILVSLNIIYLNKNNLDLTNNKFIKLQMDLKSNNNNNADYQEIRNVLETQDFECVFEMIIRNRNLIFATFDCILERLKSSKADDNFQKFSLDILENFVISYKIPIVLRINNPDFVKILKELAEIDHNKKNQINILLESCLSLFSFDKERSDIENIAKLWKELNPNAKDFPLGPEPSGFAKLYRKKQKIIKDSEDLFTLPYERKKDLPRQIEQLLKTENFQDPEFNYLETAFGIYYFNELEKILEAFDSPTNTGDEKQGNGHEIHQNLPSPRKIPSRIPNHLRKSFVLHERLNEDENVFTEYKNYYLPFNETIDSNLKKAICAFLNRYGGRLYIGVDDHKSVVGIKMESKDRDTVKTSILCLLKDFEPNIRTNELVKVAVIPIRSPVNHKIIPGIFVIKIIIKPGDPKVLYSASQTFCKFYIRNDGQSVALTPREVTTSIIERQKHSEERKIDHEFDDPEPEDIIDIEPNHLQKERQKKFIPKEEKSYATKFINKSINSSFNNKVPTVFIKGLPPGIPLHEAEKILQIQDFATNITSIRIFTQKGLVDSGDAYLNFSDEHTARLYVDLFNGLSVQNRIIKATLK